MNPHDSHSCPDLETLAALADGRLEEPERAAAEAHAGDCSACRATLRDLVDVVHGAGADAPAPAGLADRILEGLPAGQAQDRGGSMLRFRFPIAAAALLIVGVGTFFWLANADRPSTDDLCGLPPAVGPALVGEIPEALPAAEGEAVVPPLPADLGGDTRYLAHLSTDKPLYRPGEAVYARAVLLDAFTQKPLREQSAGRFQVKTARGEVVHQGLAVVQDGVAAFQWRIPPGQAGGQFTLGAVFPEVGTTPAEMEFDVRAYRVPRLKTDLQFLRKAYGPGDEVRATLEAERAEGGIPVGAAVTAVARLDGREILRKSLRLDAEGRCDIRFALPEAMRDGIGTLALRIADGGVTETAAKTLPIVLNKVALAMFPEGGALVAGVPCGLYFEARTPRDDPADVAGVIVDDTGAQVARFASVHEGRGRTSFTPQFGRSYRAVLHEPAGIDEPVLLPAVQGEGLSLRAVQSTYAHDEPIVVAVTSTKSAAATVGLYVRERELALRPIRLAAHRPARVSLVPGTHVSGVLRVTVFDDAGLPLAERLVFRHPKTALIVEVTPEAATTVPGGAVRVNVRALDAHGRGVPGAVIALAATDDAVLATVDPRERAARLPVQALLGAEVRELRDSLQYLDGDAESAVRTDLLLGTQGWRRFCFQDVPDFVRRHADAGRRALALRLPAVPSSGPIGIGGGGGGRWAAEFKDGEEQGVRPGAAQPPAGAPRPVFGPPGDRPPAEPEPADEAGAPVQDEVVEEVENDADVPFVGPGMREANDPMPPEPAPMGPVPDPAAGPAPARIPRLVGRRFRADFERRVRWMRVFAHKVATGRQPGARTDFSETVYWNAGLVTDAEGRATFEFDASDAITTLRIRADGFSGAGVLGSADGTVEVKRPFYVEPKFPLEVSAGDRIELPLALVNGTDEPLPIFLRAEVGKGMRLLEVPSGALSVPAQGSLRQVLPIQVEDFRGSVKLRLRVSAGPYADDVTRTIDVVPAGFPIEHAFGGVLEGVAVHEVVIPDAILPGSVTTEIIVYPTPLASMAEALAAMLREPCGCFEQTSSSNYPNVMALQYMESHAGVDPAFVAKAAAMLDRGYKRLVSFECKQRGYEWFGGDPGHEALTAYGVLEFHDMAKVMAVDAAMLERTRAWLLDRRDGEGGFKRNARALDQFGGAPAETTNAYVLWALAEVGETGLEKEIAALKASARATKDSYVIALAANVLWKRGDQDEARRLLTRLSALQGEDGALTGAKTSITRSGGRSLRIEATALAVLAWLRSGEHVKNVEAAMRWMSAQCQGGRFGSTQATILALKAVIAYDASRARVTEPGTVVLSLNGQPLHEVAFVAGQQGAIRLPDLADVLGSGTHALRLEMQGGGVMPYSMSISFNAVTPASAPDANVGIETRLAKTEVGEGEPIEVRVDVINRSDEGQPMAVAIVGLPGGLEARAEQLKELVREGKVDAVETRGREVVLYWRSLAPKARHALTLDCVAAVPGTYAGPASRAYLYYTDEDKVWVDGLAVKVVGR